jgi:hypothetical protein
LLTLITAIVIALGAASASAAERRVAFVAGNGAYTTLPALANPSGDAKAVAALLRTLNFEVIESIDASRDGMKAMLRTFANKALGADVALFYFAGHSVSVGGKNYLLAVDSDLKSPLDLKLADDNLDSTLDKAMADAKLQIVLLDTGRTNPLTERYRLPRGIAAMVPSNNTLIAFASAPGQAAEDGRPGENSPFTKALLAHLGEPNVDIRTAMTKVRRKVVEDTGGKQVPWETSTLDQYLNLNPAANGDQLKRPEFRSQPDDAIRTARLDPTPSEVEFWRAIRDSNTIKGFQDYIARHPGGVFVALARARITTLRDAAAAPVREFAASQETEDRLELSPADRIELLRRLGARNFFDGLPNGAPFDEEARGAIKRWQAASAFPASGYLDKRQFDKLMSESPNVARPKIAPRKAEHPAPEKRTPTTKEGLVIHPVWRIPAR